MWQMLHRTAPFLVCHLSMVAISRPAVVAAHAFVLVAALGAALWYDDTAQVLAQ
jgi:hypothetical protein